MVREKLGSEKEKQDKRQEKSGQQEGGDKGVAEELAKLKKEVGTIMVRITKLEKRMKGGEGNEKNVNRGTWTWKNIVGGNPLSEGAKRANKERMTTEERERQRRE